MKKILSFITICLLAVSANVNAQTAKIALQHNGNVTLYASDAMTTVMTAAVDGDTIYLNEGNFISDVTVNKKVSIIGVGQGTKITGNVTIAIPNNPVLSAIVLDGLYITGTLTLSSPMDKVKIRKCKFGTTTFTANVSNVIFDRCFCTDNFTLSTYVKSLTALNSKINYLQGYGYTPDAANFVNCNIYLVCTYYSGSNYQGSTYAFKGVIINSILYSYDYYSSYTYLGPDVFLANCLIGSSKYDYFTKYSVSQNCMSSSGISYSGNFMNSSTLECGITNEALQNNNLLGNDGKVVGIYGGTTPFTLVPSVPTVTSSKIAVDAANKKLNVDIKVTAN